MPGAEAELYREKKDVWYHVNFLSVAAEFLGTALFAYYGGLAFASSAAVTNGVALIVLVYAFAAVSGGHLNPVSTLIVSCDHRTDLVVEKAGFACSKPKRVG